MSPDIASNTFNNVRNESFPVVYSTVYEHSIIVISQTQNLLALEINESDNHVYFSS